MFSVNDPIVGTSRGSLAQAIAFSEESRAKRPSDVRNFLTELWRLSDLVGFDASLLTAQSALETANWTSHFWEHELNAGGIGKFPDGSSQSMIYRNGIDSARAFSVHMAIYVFGGGSPVWLQLGQYRALDPRLEAVSDAGFAGTVKVLGDLGSGRWATDPNYATKIADRANQIFKDLVQESSMAIVATECPIEIAVVWSGPNRPGLAMRSPSKIVTHEVGNKSPGADEEMHKRFVHNGGGAAQVSFHFVVGPTKIVQLLYLDENAWHASDGYYGDGNRDAWGIEHIQIGDFSRTLNHGAWLQAELVRNPRRFAIKQPGAFVPDITPANVRDRMVRHYDEAPDKKWCPEMIMNRGLWEPYKDAVVRELIPPAPVEPVEPVPIEPIAEPFPGFTHGLRTGTDQHVGNVTYQFIERIMTVRKGRQAPGYDRPGGKKVVTITEGEKILSAFIADIDGRMWLWDDQGVVYSRSPFSPKLTLQRLK